MTIEMPGIIAIVLALGAGLYTAGRDIPGARRWVLGGVAGMLGVVGLFAAAGSGVGRPVSYYGGVGLFVLSARTSASRRRSPRRPSTRPRAKSRPKRSPSSGWPARSA